MIAPRVTAVGSAAAIAAAAATALLVAQLLFASPFCSPVGEPNLENKNLATAEGRVYCNAVVEPLVYIKSAGWIEFYTK